MGLKNIFLIKNLAEIETLFKMVFACIDVFSNLKIFRLPKSFRHRCNLMLFADNLFHEELLFIEITIFKLRQFTRSQRDNARY